MIFIQGFSLINAMGETVDEILHSLSTGKSPGMEESSSFLIGEKRAFFGRVKCDLPLIPKEFKNHDSRNNRLLLKCFLNQETLFRKLLKGFDPSRVGVILGTSTSGSAEADEYIHCVIEGKEDSFHSYCQEMGDPSRFLSLFLGLSGPSYTISTACTSSTRTFISAYRLIETGIIDAAFVGGVDTLARMPINGFNSLASLSEELCRPFGKNRHGITIGEAAGLFFLSKEKSPIELKGFGESSDAYHMTAPHPEGTGAEKAMKDALAMALLSSSDIVYLNLHGTGTPLNDQAEAKAVHKVFEIGVPATSTKNLTGHCLGAAGATEAGILCCLLTRENGITISPQYEDENEIDPNLEAFGLLRNKAHISRGPMMTNNFAFGGNNASLIIGPNDE